MNVLSLFDGISCGQVALERAGIKVNKYFASEIDKYAINITQKNYPQTIQLGDIQFLSKETFALNKIDLIMGGSPCQGFSYAGKQLNFDDPRSKLFFDFVRLKNDLNPRYFFFENVKMKKEWIDIINSYLNCEPIEIPSALVSAQDRKRLYWTNIPFEMPEDEEIYLADVIEKDFAFTKKAQTILSTMYKENPKSMFKRNKKGLLACSKQCAGCKFIRKKSKTVRSGGLQSYQRHEWDSVCQKHLRKLTPLECERLQNLPDNYTDCVSNTQRYKALGNGWTVNVVAHIFKGILNE